MPRAQARVLVIVWLKPLLMVAGSSRSRTFSLVRSDEQLAGTPVILF